MATVSWDSVFCDPSSVIGRKSLDCVCLTLRHGSHGVVPLIPQHSKHSLEHCEHAAAHLGKSYGDPVPNAQ
eukprot:4678265-Amphidinium_carterae.3